MPRTIAVSTLVILAATGLTAAAFAQEHPEHPMNAPSPATPGLTKNDLAHAITNYIDTQAKEHDGFFTIHDPVDNRDLKLKLVKVHRDRLARVAPDTYFACTDLRNVDGVIYDLDFFMKGSDPNNLAFSDVSIHKKAGKARYTWYEEGGVWKKKPVGATETPAPPSKQSMEHPGR